MIGALLPVSHPVEVNPTIEKEALDAWQDPNPAPVLEVIDGIHVVRDDLLLTGSKARGLDYLIGHSPTHRDVEEWVYGSSPAHGYAQISLPHVCAKYGKKAVIFMAKRSMANLHPYQQRGLDLGGDYRWVPDGMLSVTEKRARDYVAESPTTRRLIPIGGDSPLVVACLAKVAKSLPIKPGYVWSVGSSGTLTRALQAAWPNAEFHVVSVGRKMGEHEAGKARIWTTPWVFSKPCPVDLRPPFPSVPEYDAKAWPIIQTWCRPRPVHQPILFWNVGA